MTNIASDIRSIIKSVTKEWTKQRKAEERGRRSRYSRMYIYSDRVNFTDVVNRILPAGYAHASGDGKYPVAQRQLFYACREEFKKATGRELESKYFTNTLLRQYLNRNSEKTAGWKITADPRGTLTIPNAGYEVRVPCGTLAIEDHIRCASISISHDDIDVQVPIEWPSLKYGQRYQGVLYIEKEGFEPLLKDAKIAERFDLAILSCKGQSVVAARKFVDEVCYKNGGVPLFVVHDFDKAGFEISQSLTRVSEWAEWTDRVAYHFKHEINVVDLGLRLADVERYALQSESVEFRGGFQRDSICTDQEKLFLRSHRRVELNAFTSPQFIEWLEGKLGEHIKGRLEPDKEVLEKAYRRAIAVAKINGAIEKMVKDAKESAKHAAIPKTLRKQLRKLMKESPGAWDKVLYELAEATVGDQ